MPSDENFEVASRRCDECLFGPGKVVNNGRRHEVMARCRRQDRFFMCHKTKNVCCRGWFETFSCTFSQIMARLGLVRFVPVSPAMPEEEDPQGGLERLRRP